MRVASVLLCACACVVACVSRAASQEPSLNLEAGQVCKRQGTQVWTCKGILSCPKALKDYQNSRKRPEVCNFQGKHPVVCCEPDVKSAPAGVKTKQMCKKYAEAVIIRIPSEFGNEEWTYDTCAADVEPLIVGGTDAVPKEYPHMALIGYGSERSKEWLCGGSLISDRFILSAAHCTQTSKGRAQWALLGEYNRRSKVDDDKGLSQPTEYEIVERINHPGYRPPSLYDDIALYRLKTPVEFNEYIRPVCLQTSTAVDKSYAIATGWGRTDIGGRLSDVLQKVNVTLTSRSECRRLYNSAGEELKNGIRDSTMFCAGNSEKDSCQGDSGGPLQLRLSDPYCMYSQIGVTSFGEGCAFKPGVYTRVSYYIPWIESKVWP